MNTNITTINTKNKKILAKQLACIYNSSIETFVGVVNNQLTNWERRNIILMISFYGKPITIENIYDALTA